MDWKYIRLQESLNMAGKVMGQRTTEIMAYRLRLKMFGPEMQRRGWY